jgi:hypothetical protein
MKEIGKIIEVGGNWGIGFWDGQGNNAKKEIFIFGLSVI